MVGEVVREVVREVVSSEAVIQWNLSIMVTLGPTISGCYREVTC